jgi:NAD(P)-dependent dehydrogenase (short-subunit alcohol dehydrogenase family)
MPEQDLRWKRFLLSPRSEYMTGEALSVDGGLVMHG